MNVVDDHVCCVFLMILGEKKQLLYTRFCFSVLASIDENGYCKHWIGKRCSSSPYVGGIPSCMLG